MDQSSPGWFSMGVPVRAKRDCALMRLTAPAPTEAAFLICCASSSMQKRKFTFSSQSMSRRTCA